MTALSVVKALEWSGELRVESGDPKEAKKRQKETVQRTVEELVEIEPVDPRFPCVCGRRPDHRDRGLRQAVAVQERVHAGEHPAAAARHTQSSPLIVHTIMHSHY